MKPFGTFAFTKSVSYFFILSVAFLIIPFNVMSTEATPSISKTSHTVSKETTTERPNQTTTSPIPTSTADEETEWCPIAFIYEGNQQQQNLLKEFRDKVLADHKKGITYTKLYYIHSPEITIILLSHDDIKMHAQKILNRLLPVITDLINKGTAEISQALINDIDALLNEIAHQASSPLREAIRMAKSDLIKKEIFKEMNITIIK